MERSVLQNHGIGTVFLQLFFNVMYKTHCNCNWNWGTCIAPPTGRPRARHRVNPYPGARRQNETEMFSDHDETSLSIAAVLAPSVACSMLTVQQQKRLCRQFVDLSAARRGCHTHHKKDTFKDPSTSKT